MARKDIGALIHCDVCGEDYSATYKRCPFCGGQQKYDEPDLRDEVDEDEADEEDGYVFDGQDAFDDDYDMDERAAHSRGGKRLAHGGGRRRPRSGGSSGGGPVPPINWPRLITFLCSLVIIVAALVIVFTVIYPKLHSDPKPSNSVPTVPSETVPSQPVSQESTEPGVSAEPSADVNPLAGMTLSSYDFTLWPIGDKDGKDKYTLRVTFDPADWEGEVTFTSNDESIATVDANGLVSNTNTSSSLRRAIITVTAGGQSAECVVYCRGGGTGSTQPPEVVTPTPTPSVEPTPSASASTAPSGGLKPGAGVVVNAGGGVRVRSGPGTSYEVLGSLFNGSSVTVVSDAGDGWYEITYWGRNGKETGYMMGDYISQ